MLKKELGLALLILVIGGVSAFINPQFISQVNLLNLSNQIGLFGLFALGEGFVIITGGIDLSIGSMLALLGVDLPRSPGQPRLWLAPRPRGHACGRRVAGFRPRRSDHAAEAATVHRHPVRPFALSWHRPLVHAGFDARVWLRDRLRQTRMADVRANLRHPPHFHLPPDRRRDPRGRPAQVDVRPLPIRGRQE